MKKGFILAFVLGIAAGVYAAVATQEFIKGWREAAERRRQQEEKDYNERMVDWGSG